MRLTGGEIVARALADEGIHHAFGIPGTHNIELYDALLHSPVRPVLVTDEQSAGFMADGYWRASARLACVNVVPGAGLTHAMSGIAEAFLDGIPMLVLGCGIRRGGKAFQLHDVDQLAMVRPVVKQTMRPADGAEIYPMIRAACALARGGAPGPVMVEIPIDFYLSRHAVEVSWAPPLPPPPPPPPPLPSESAFEDVRARLRGRRPLLYVGLGARGASSDLVALAERLESPVATTISGKGVFPEHHPLFLWNGLGNSAPSFVQDIARSCDATLAIGCRFSEVGTGSWGFTPPGDLLHVDIDPFVLGRNYATACPITADAATFVAGLLPRLESSHSDPTLRDRILRGHAAVRARPPGPPRTRVTPAVLLDSIQEALGPETIYTADSGNGLFLAMERLRLPGPGRFLAPVDYSCMGYSVPAAIGAGLARPGVPVVALAGDGAFLMTGLELLTAANQGVPVAVFVLRDRELAQIAQFQATAFNRKTASVLPDFDVGGLVNAVGVQCVALQNDEGIPPALDQVRAALAGGRPVVVDVAIDYAEKTHFTRGVVKTTLGRLPWADRLRFIGRALARRLT